MVCSRWWVILRCHQLAFFIAVGLGDARSFEYAGYVGVVASSAARYPSTSSTTQCLGRLGSSAPFDFIIDVLCCACLSPLACFETLGLCFLCFCWQCCRCIRCISILLFNEFASKKAWQGLNGSTRRRGPGGAAGASSALPFRARDF